MQELAGFPATAGRQGLRNAASWHAHMRPDSDLGENGEIIDRDDRSASQGRPAAWGRKSDRRRPQPYLPRIPIDEAERQRAVDRTGIVGRPRDSRLQRIVEETAGTFRMPIAALSIVDHDRQWFAAITGLDVEETPRAVSLCAHVINRPSEAMVVRDAARDGRFSRNPLVAAAPHLRFYAGIALLDRSGNALGALCIIDRRARHELIDIPELLRLARHAEQLIAG